MIQIPQVTHVQVEAAEPEASDLRTIQHLASTRSAAITPVSWVVRVQLDQVPAASGQALELLIGHDVVRKYTQIPGGVAFVVNDPERLQNMLGKELSWRIPGDSTVHNSGVRLTAAMPVASGVLPTKREVFERQ